MTLSQELHRELIFLLKQRAVLALLVFVAACASFTVWSGLEEIDQQRATIDHLLSEDRIDREAVLEGQSDYGGAAYYSFHLTYDAPSDGAFLAFGQRDDHSWKHRIRMLALEGQIYESDAGNPALAINGTFDYLFLASVLLPLFVIVLLYDLFAAEHPAGRFFRLAAPTGNDERLWRLRAFVRSSLLALAILLPMWLGAGVAGTGLSTVLLVSLVVLGHLLFWSVIAYWFAKRNSNGPVIATQLLGLWVVLALLLPFLGGVAVTTLVAAPENSEIVLGQREAVNDAWDLPKETTMNAFVERYPEWGEQAEITAPFEWKWYYAFQEVGDQSVESLSTARRESMAARHTATGYLALLSPPLLTQRLLARIAETDVIAALHYEEEIRAFHATLRAFYYPLMFGDAPYSLETLQQLPDFVDPTAGS
ncbi:MAG: DUF3526 domain-containing protein [Pseudomonadota bacterium]